MNRANNDFDWIECFDWLTEWMYFRIYVFVCVCVCACVCVCVCMYV